MKMRRVDRKLESTCGSNRQVCSSQNQISFRDLTDSLFVKSDVTVTLSTVGVTHTSLFVMRQVGHTHTQDLSQLVSVIFQPVTWSFPFNFFNNWPQNISTTTKEKKRDGWREILSASQHKSSFHCKFFKTHLLANTIPDKIFLPSYLCSHGALPAAAERTMAGFQVNPSYKSRPRLVSVQWSVKRFLPRQISFKNCRLHHLAPHKHNWLSMR